MKIKVEAVPSMSVGGMDVLVNGDYYGLLLRGNKGEWVLWQRDLDDGVSYEPSLQDTVDEISGDLSAGLEG